MNEILTDNEIMKNVRCCADNYCMNCSLQGKPNCKNTLFSLAWNMMYDLKTANEKLEKKYELAVAEREANVKGFTEELEKQRIKIERLEKGQLRKALTFNCKTIRRCNSEAIKEFAEKLKVKVGKSVEIIHICDDFKYLSLSEIIDNLVKEMEKDK